MDRQGVAWRLVRDHSSLSRPCRSRDRTAGSPPLWHRSQWPGHQRCRPSGASCCRLRRAGHGHRGGSTQGHDRALEGVDHGLERGLPGQAGGSGERSAERSRHARMGAVYRQLDWRHPGLTSPSIRCEPIPRPTLRHGIDGPALFELSSVFCCVNWRKMGPCSVLRIQADDGSAP